MFGDGSLTFREFAMREPLPLATIHDAVLEFLRGRVDAVLFGAQAVNAYVDEPRMTQDVDIASTRGEAFADELRAFLHQRFHIAVRVREVREGLGYRIYQVRKAGESSSGGCAAGRDPAPRSTVKKGLGRNPAELVANKLMSMVAPAAQTQRND